MLSCTSALLGLRQSRLDARVSPSSALPAMRRWRVAWIASCSLRCWPRRRCAQAEKRVALVVGNSAYQHARRLTNPANDAADVAAALKSSASR